MDVKENKGKGLVIFCAFLIGVIVGFLIAPIKKGMNFKINNNLNDKGMSCKCCDEQDISSMGCLDE